MSTVEMSLSKPQHQPEAPSSAAPVPPLASVTTETSEIDSVPAVVVKSQLRRNRCRSCKRRVGLTGFTCRCGTTFCGTHRYPEMHGCTFDFKTMGKEAITKANPVVKAAKLEKI